TIVEVRDALLELRGIFIGSASAPWPQPGSHHPAPPSGPHYGHASGLQSGPQAGMQPGQPSSGVQASPSRSAPWWTWLIAAIAAVAVGAAAAFWYGGSRSRDGATSTN